MTKIRIEAERERETDRQIEAQRHRVKEKKTKVVRKKNETQSNTVHSRYLKVQAYLLVPENLL